MIDNLIVLLCVENLFDKEYNVVDVYGIDLDGDFINDEFYYYNMVECCLFVGVCY